MELIENIKEHQKLRRQFLEETGIYAIKDNKSYILWLEKKLVKKLTICDVVSSAYIVKVEGNGTMIILAENIADACDKLEVKGYENYTFVKSTSLDVLY